MNSPQEACELCEPDMVLFGDKNVYARYDNNNLSLGHVLVILRRQDLEACDGFI